MATTPKNRIVQSVSPKSIFPEVSNLVDATISYNQGDLLFLDEAAHLVKPVVGDASGEFILGIAPQTVVLGKPRSAYQGTAVDAAQAFEALSGPVYGVVATMKLKVGDSFVPGGDIFCSAVDAQTVSSAGTKLIGVYQGAAVTAVSGSQGPVLLGAAIAGVLAF